MDTLIKRSEVRIHLYSYLREEEQSRQKQDQGHNLKACLLGLKKERRPVSLEKSEQ